MAEPKRPRLILHNFLSLDLCKELEFIHKSCSTVGYRPNVFSTTLSHLIATNSAHLIMPFVGIRERLKEKAEEFFGCEYELFVEFTGLISWTRGASIGWHSDDNRPYLKQRDYAAVCYLNGHGKDFKGGIFHFQDGEPAAIAPVIGDIVMYTADNRNIHSVDEITEGERLTLTLWFSRDSSHDEDAKLLSLLSHYSILQEELTSYLPLPASSNMYWFSLEQAYHEQSGFDIRLARVHVLGFTFHFSDDKRYYSGLESYSDISELLMKPLKLARQEEIFHKEFVNSLHALQVLQFYCWKASELQATKVGRESSNVVQVSQSVLEQRNILEAVLMGDPQLPETVFGCVSYKQDKQPSFDWADVSAAVSVWEDYTRKLCKDLFMCLSYWRTHQSIFSISDIECGT